ncbi:MAG: hydrogenase/urease maturation nickel metallochaperone HypA [Gemmatimonadota bacterium]|nr:hydrogenase/urease maturation nickel metallochaperone HypA [Gemmatimonadota bacterium]
MSVALEICNLAEEQVGRDALPRIRALGLEVGDRAGVVVANLEFCLETLLERAPYAGAELVIERREGEVLRLSWLDVDEEEDAA